MTCRAATGRARARSRWLVAALALGVAVVAGGRIAAATGGLVVTHTDVGGTPVTILVADDTDAPPGVVVAHGFAGSRQLMRTFGVALAQHGYAVALPDLAGHGANTGHLDPAGDVLVAEVLRARILLVEAHGVPDDAVALLGHSMGSGAVMRTGIEHPDLVAAVVAVSPTDAAVTPELPPDLKLLAGSLEGRFVANAEELLARAGGAGGTPGTDGRARDLEVVPGVEHVSILFNPSAHVAAATWLDAVTGRTPAPLEPVWLIGWWLLALGGVVLAWRVAAPSLVDGWTGARHGTGAPPVERTPGSDGGSWRRRVIALAGGTAGGTAALVALGRVLPLADLGGMLVGPVLALWFLLVGALWWWMGPNAGRPGRQDVVGTVLLLGVLVLAFGALAPAVWLPVVPGGVRSGYLAPFTVSVLPWTVAFTAGLRGRHGWGTLGWWAATSVALLLGVGVAAVTVPGLGFVLLLLPLLPALLGLVTVVVTPWVRHAGSVWGPALTAAGFLGWIMAVLFPLT